MYVLMVILVLMVVWGVMIYNALVRLNNQVKNALAQIDVQLKRRHDLIPNLVETTKGYLVHENQTLQAVIQARQVAKQAQNAPKDDNYITKVAQAESMLSGALANLYAVAENYPELKADSIIKELFDELTHTENRIGFARQHYNDSVMSYNTRREIFPNNLVSGWFGFHQAMSLEFDEHSFKQAPRVDLSI